MCAYVNAEEDVVERDKMGASVSEGIEYWGYGFGNSDAVFFFFKGPRACV